MRPLTFGTFTAISRFALYRSLCRVSIELYTVYNGLVTILLVRGNILSLQQAKFQPITAGAIRSVESATQKQKQNRYADDNPKHDTEQQWL